MSDSAAFREKDVIAIWGERPHCVLTGVWQFCDLQHVLGRGGKHNRNISSSILNSVPLQRDIHKGPYRDHPLMRKLFLEITRKRVMNYVMLGEYELTDRDKEFLAYADEWQKNH